METQLDAMRETVSQQLTGISRTSLGVLLEAIEEVTDKLAQCTTSLPSVVPEIERMGSQLSQCALLIDLRIQALTNSFFDVLVRPQDASIALLSAVLDHVGHSNPVDTPTQVAADIDRTLEALRNEFVNEMVPTLQREVDNVEAGNVIVQQVARTCVDQVLEHMHTLTADC